MSWAKKIHKPSDVVKPGESVEIVVLGVNSAVEHATIAAEIEKLIQGRPR